MLSPVRRVRIYCQEYMRMVQFCPRCGTQAPDDESVFCNKCGMRLPPPVPEKKELVCPACRTKSTDEHSLFCNRCGSPLRPLPAVPARPAAPQPPAAPPVVRAALCPACGAPLVDAVSAYCNICGAYLAGPAPAGTARAPARPVPERPEPAPPAPAPARLPPERPAPAAAAEGTGGTPPAPAGRRPPIRRALIAGAAVVVLVLIAAALAVMLPGTGNPDNVPGAGGTDPAAVVTTPVHTATATPAPVKTTAKPPATTVKATTVPTAPPANATPDATANVTAVPTATPRPTPTITNSSQPLSIGQGAYDGNGRLTVNDISFVDKMSDPTPSYAVGKKYLIINITYVNMQENRTATADLSMMKLSDGGGFTFEPASDALLENVYSGTAIPAQETRTGNLLYIVPPEATYLKLQYTFGSQNTVTFQLT